MIIHKKKPVTPKSLSIFDVLLAPVVTEKATVDTQNGHYAFKVAKQSTKHDIKLAVETLYKVKVKSVNTLNQKGKVKRFRGRLGRRSDVKKAIVCLLEGQTIDLGAGL
ncbi:50S ribosomal protein L23 [mine drainage metagenome]|uniref:50S ribosomal protein L23 n=1 Tax=mine drainage metagenome TaxID=410659 RepID=T0YK32_9ZZZZ